MRESHTIYVLEDYKKGSLVERKYGTSGFYEKNIPTFVKKIRKFKDGAITLNNSTDSVIEIWRLYRLMKLLGWEGLSSPRELEELAIELSA